MADRHVTAPPQADSLHRQHQRAIPTHVGGNEKLRNAGRTFTGGNVAGDIRDSGEGAAILAHENVLIRLTKAERRPARPPPATRCPPTPTTSTYYKLSHFFNGEGMQLFHVPNAHTDGDSIVHFRGLRRDRARAI